MRWPDRRAKSLCLFALGAIAGCRINGVVEIRVPQSGDSAARAYNDDAWATVVRENVKAGLVDYEHLAAHRDALNEYLATVARIGPTSTPGEFPTPADQLAYYINAYNAGVLAAVLESGIPPTMCDENRQLPIDQRFSLAVDGGVRRLSDIRESALAVGNGDARVVFALCDAAKDAPPLHDQPFRPDDLDKTLQHLIHQAIENPQLVHIDHLAQSIALAGVFHRYHTLFVQDYQRRTNAAEGTLYNAILHFADLKQRHRLQSAIGYEITTVPSDYALNIWQPEASTPNDPLAKQDRLDN